MAATKTKPLTRAALLDMWLAFRAEHGNEQPGRVIMTEAVARQIEPWFPDRAGNFTHLFGARVVLIKDGAAPEIWFHL